MAYDLEDGERAIKLGAYRQAFEIFMMLCVNQEDPAFYKLSEMAINKQLEEDELQRLIDMMREEVRKKNGEATFNLAVVYWRAPYATKDIEKAVEYLNAACRMEVAQAFVALAKLYMGEGAHLPLATGSNIMNLLHQGFEHGSVEAAHLIAKEHLSGHHAKKDNYEAFKYLFIAGRLGITEAKKHTMVMQGLNASPEFKMAQQEAMQLIEHLENQMVKWV